MPDTDLDPSGSGWTPRVASFYSRSAEGYEELWAPELVKLSLSLLEVLPLGSARRILDLGSGVGTLLPEIYRRAPDALVVATDLAHGMLRRAPDEFPRVTSDAQQLPFAPSSFDAAILAFMLFHVPQPQRALVETRRVVRSGAVLGTITWGDDPPYPALDIWLEELDSHGAQATEPIGDHGPVDTEAKVRALFEDTGFRDVRTWTGTREERQTAEEFLRHRLGHGTSRHRFESLAEDARSACLEKVRTRLEGLGPEDFVDRSEVIYAMGVAS